MRVIVMAMALGLPGLAMAEKVEWTLELRFQPDDSGMPTTNKSVSLEDGEIGIEESGETRKRLDDRDATEAETAALTGLVRGRLYGLSLEAGPEVDRPQIEVIIEWESGDRQIEFVEYLAVGAVPADVVAVQKMFLADVYE